MATLKELVRTLRDNVAYWEWEERIELAIDSLLRQERIIHEKPSVCEKHREAERYIQSMGRHATNRMIKRLQEPKNLATVLACCEQLLYMHAARAIDPMAQLLNLPISKQQQDKECANFKWRVCRILTDLCNSVKRSIPITEWQRQAMHEAIGERNYTHLHAFGESTFDALYTGLQSASTLKDKVFFIQAMSNANAIRANPILVQYAKALEVKYEHDVDLLWVLITRIGNGHGPQAIATLAEILNDPFFEDVCQFTRHDFTQEMWNKLHSLEHQCVGYKCREPYTIWRGKNDAMLRRRHAAIDARLNQDRYYCKHKNQSSTPWGSVCLDCGHEFKISD